VLPIIATVPGIVRAATTTILQDGFESGAFQGWSSVSTGGDGIAAVQATDVFEGSFAARLVESNSSTSFARARVSPVTPVGTMTVTAAIKVTADGALNSNVPLIRLFDAAGTRVVSFYRQNATQDFLYVNHSGIFAKTAAQLALNTWVTLSLTVTGGGTSGGTVTATVNGSVIYQATGASLGTGGIATAQFGNEVKGQTFELRLDSVIVTTDDGSTPSPSPSPSPSASPSASPSPSPSPSSSPSPSVSPSPSPTPTDTTPPDTTIVSGPPISTSASGASFTFTATEPATFECSLDSATFASCASPQSYTGLALGSHTFRVRATDTAGNVDQTPAAYTWTIVATSGCSSSTPAPTNSDPGTVVIADNFEGGLGQWTKISTQGDATIQIVTDKFKTGQCAVRTKVTSAVWDSRGNLEKFLPSGTGEVWLTGWFNIERDSPDPGWNVPTFRLFSDGKRVLDVSRQNVTGNIFLRFPNGVGGWSYIMTGRKMDLNRWYQVKVHARANGNLSTVEVWLDGVRYINTSSVTLGVWAIDMAMLGAEHQNQEGDVVADDVVVKAIVPPPTNTIFADDWESGGFGAWSSVQVGGDGSVAAQSSTVKSGSWSGKLAATANAGSLAYARQSLLSAENDLMVTADVYVSAEGAAGGSVPLVSFFDPGGVKRVALTRLNQNGDRLVVEHSGTTANVAGTLPLNTWAKIRVRAVERGIGTDLVEIWINDVLAYQTDTANNGISGIKTVQIGNNTAAKAFGLIADNLVLDKGAAGLGNDPRYKLLVADYLNKRLLITDFDGRVVWRFDNPLQRADYTAGPIGVRWMTGNKILATFGTGEVGLIDVATKRFDWKVWGFNGDAFQSPYDAELLPDGNLAVALRFNNGGRISVYNLQTGEEVWKHYLSNAHSVHFRTAAQSYNSDDPTLLVGGWGNIREVAYRPNGGQNVTWQVKSEYTHDAIVVENDRLITTEGYYVQKIDRVGTKLWKKMTPDEDRRIAVNPNAGGGYVFTVAESDRIEFRDQDGNLLRDWSALSDGTGLDYPYGIQIIDYPG
jgi:hypothetical protein